MEGFISMHPDRVEVAVKPTPWPSDAVMIVAAKRGEEDRSKMESVHFGECRHCGCEVAYDGRTMGAALFMPARKGRPIKFFCFGCHALYDINAIDELVDHR